MNYICLIYADEDKHPKPGSPESEEMMSGYMEFSKEVMEKEIFIAGEPLEGIETASSVRVREGQAQITDGPFAETKEQLGGFYMLNCKNLDEALEYAAKIPSAKFGTIEVRPILEMNHCSD